MREELLQYLSEARGIALETFVNKIKGNENHDNRYNIALCNTISKDA